MYRVKNVQRLARRRREALTIFIIVSLSLSPLIISNVSSGFSTNTELSTDDKISSVESETQTSSVQEQVPEDDAYVERVDEILPEKERPREVKPIEEKPILLYGQIEIEAMSSSLALDLPFEVIKILPDNTEKVVYEGMTSEKTVKLPEGVYIINVIGDSEIESLPIVLRANKVEKFTALFSKISIFPYSFTSDFERVQVQLKEGNKVVWGPKLIDVDSTQEIYVRPGQYQLESPDQSTFNKELDATIDRDIAVLAIRNAEPIDFDSQIRSMGTQSRTAPQGTVTFGDLQINATTYRNMPLSGVSMRWFDNTTNPTSNRCAGGVYGGTTDVSGRVSVTIAPGQYKVCAYKSFDTSPIWFSSVNVLGGNTTTLDVSFSRIQLYTSTNDYATISNSTFTFGSTWTGTDGIYTYYMIPGTYSIALSTDPNIGGIVLGYKDSVKVGLVFDNTPKFTSVTTSTRVLPNGQATIYVRAKDIDFDNLTFYFSVNLGTLLVGNPYWIQDSIWGIEVNYTAPTTSGFYELSIGVQDTGALFSNYTLYLSDRQSTVSIYTREMNFAPINTYVVVYQYATDNFVSSWYTGSDGNVTFSLYDGRYYFKYYQSNTYVSPAYKIDADFGPYEWQYNWSRITITTTAEWDRPFSASIRLFNNSNLATAQSTMSTSSTTGTGYFIVMPYTDYSISATATNKLWNNSISVAEAANLQVSFSFGGLGVYTFTGGTPENRYFTLYNETDGTTIMSTWTGSDGLSLLRLRPYNNYSVYDNDAMVWFKNITVVAGTAISVGNFTNSAPVISSIDTTPSGTRITSSQSVNITVVASDVDPIDNINYVWSANVGSIAGSGATITYTAPAINTSYKITVTVQDQNGGSTSTYIYVSDRTATLTFNATKANGAPLNEYMTIRRTRDNSHIQGIWLGSDGLYTTTLKDGEYYASMYLAGTTIRRDFIADANNITLYFNFAEFIFNSTASGNRGIYSSIEIRDPVTRASISTAYTSSYTGISSNVVIKPGVYDLKVYSSTSGAAIWIDNVTINPNELKRMSFVFGEVLVNVTAAHNNPINAYIRYYNSTSGSYLGGVWTGINGLYSLYLPTGNYTFTVNEIQELGSYNNTIKAGELTIINLEFGRLLAYANNGTTPENLLVKVYYAGTTNLVISQSTGSDGIIQFNIIPGTYDIFIDTTSYTGVVIQAGQRTTIGTRLNSAPVIVDIIQATDIGASTTQTIIIQVSDADYDYGQLTLLTTPNVGTVSGADMYFNTADKFYISFNYTSPSSLGLYAINITVSDGELNDTYYLVVSQGTNVIHMTAIRGASLPYSSAITIYDHQSGDITSSFTLGSDGFETISIVDGWYDIKFGATTSLWFYSVFLSENKELNLTAAFGDLSIYSTGASGNPLNSYVILRYQDGTYVTASWTGSDGKLVWVLAPGEYNVEVIEDASIFFNVTILGGRDAFLGNDIPQLASDVPDITYKYGTTGNTLTWEFTDTSPHMYVVSIDGTMYENGTWDGTPITINVDGLEVGEHLVRIYVNDTNGLANTDFVTVTVTAPQGPYAGGPKLMTLEFGESLLYNWSVSAVSPDKYMIFDDSIVVEYGTWNNGTIAYNVGSRPAGVYNLTLFLNDTFGEIFVHTAMITFLSDPVPQFSLLPTDLTFGFWSSDILTWSVIDNNPTIYRVLRDDVEVSTGTILNDTTVSYNIAGLSPGVYNYTIVAYDESGGFSSSSVSVTVLEDTSAPELSSPFDVEIYQNDTGSFEWTFSDVQNGTYTVTVNGTVILSGTFSISGNVVIDYSNMSVGVHVFRITVVDDSGNEANDEVVVTIFEIIEEPQPPAEFKSTPNDLVTGIGNISLTWEFDAWDQGSYEILVNGTTVESGSWTSDPKSITFEYTLNGTGFYTVEIVLTSTSGTLTHSVQVTFMVGGSTVSATATFPTIYFIVVIMSTLVIFRRRKQV